MTDQLTVIIPCHQAAGVLGLQLQALASQMDAPPFEVVIVDNRSTDHLEQVSTDYEAVLLASGATRVRVVRAELRAGAAYARNVGVTHAKNDRLVFCDADDCVSEHWLRDASELFEQADVFSGSAIPVSEEIFAGGHDVVRAAFDEGEAGRATLEEQAYQPIPILMGGNFGITRTLYLKIGGFDESLVSGGEDNDIALRIRQTGLPILGSGAMRLGYRIRGAESGLARAQRRAATAHVLLCVRAGLLSQSQYIGRARLLLLSAKFPLATIRSVVTGNFFRDRADLAVRGAAVAGFWHGILQYVVLRRAPDPILIQSSDVSAEGALE